MADEKCDTLQAKAIEMVRYRYLLNVCVHAQTGRCRVLFAFFFLDDQLYTKLNKVAIAEDSCIHSSAQGRAAEARPLSQIWPCSSGSKLLFYVFRGMYATRLDANGVYTEDRLHCSSESGVRKNLRATPASFYRENILSVSLYIWD